MIRFSKYMWIYGLLSLFVIVPGMYSLVRWGLRPSVDFTGGTLLELKFETPIDEDVIVKEAQKKELAIASLQKSGNDTFVLRFKPETEEKMKAFQEGLVEAAGKAPEIVRLETVGPTLGKELLVKAVTAAMLAIFVILAYIAYAFRAITFGVSAVVALLHDLLVVIGTFSLLGHFFNVEVDTLFVTAFLTTMSFSVHDTIVVFDRIREILKKGERIPFEAISDKALTQTMVRSLTNSFTIIFMLSALILMGGETIRWFVVALLVGTISGTYSSPFVATPILILLAKNRKKH